MAYLFFGRSGAVLTYLLCFGHRLAPLSGSWVPSQDMVGGLGRGVFWRQ